MAEEGLYFYSNNEIVSWYKIYKCCPLHFNTIRTISIVKLTFLNVIYWKKLFLNFFAYHQRYKFERLKNTDEDDWKQKLAKPLSGYLASKEKTGLR
jgi:hypothetical protein